MRKIWIDTSPEQLGFAESKLLRTNLKNEAIILKQELIPVNNNGYINTLHIEQDHTRKKTPVVRKLNKFVLSFKNIIYNYETLSNDMMLQILSK